MSLFKLIWSDLAQIAALTASSSAGADYAAENVLTDILADAWKTAGTLVDEWLVFDLGEVKDITAFLVFAHDLQPGETVKIQANASDSWGSPSVDVTLTYNDSKLKYFWATVQSFRYWRLLVAKSGASEVRSFGKVMVAQQFEVTENVAYDGIEWGLEDLSDGEVTKSGQYYADQNAILDTVSCEFPFSSITQMEEFKRLAKTLGRSRCFAISIDDDDKPFEWLFFGRSTRLGGFEMRTYNDAASSRWDLVLKMIEAR